MSSSLAGRHVRRVCTAAAAAVGVPSISISKAKSRLKSEFDPDKALEIYASVSKHYSSPVSSRYAQDLTVKRLAKSRRFADIESLIESHKTDPKITEEPFLCTLIRSYGSVGMFDHALKTYDQMDELGTPRSSLSFNALLSACNHSKLYDQIPKLFDEIPPKHGFSPDKISYGILVKSYCTSGSVDLAMDTLKEMEKKGIEITTITYTTILDSLYKTGMSDEAERVWNEMVAKGCSPDVGAYNVRTGHAQGKDPEIVKGLIEEMNSAGLKPDTITYNYLMVSYCRSGMLLEAKKIYEELEDVECKPNAATFRTLIFYMCKNNRFEAAYDLFKQSVKVHKIPDFNTLKHLAEGLLEKSKKKEAKGLIRTMKKKFPPELLKAWKKLEEDLGLAAAKSEVEHRDKPDSCV